MHWPFEHDDKVRNRPRSPRIETRQPVESYAESSSFEVHRINKTIYNLTRWIFPPVRSNHVEAGNLYVRRRVDGQKEFVRKKIGGSGVHFPTSGDDQDEHDDGKPGYIQTSVSYFRTKRHRRASASEEGECRDYRPSFADEEIDKPRRRHTGDSHERAQSYSRTRPSRGGHKDEDASWQGSWRHCRPVRGRSPSPESDCEVYALGRVRSDESTLRGGDSPRRHRRRHRHHHRHRVSETHFFESSKDRDRRDHRDGSRSPRFINRHPYDY